MENFTINDATKIQQKQIEKWAIVLKPKFIELMKEWCNYCNSVAKTVDGVPRGTTIENWLHNMFMNK